MNNEFTVRKRTIRLSCHEVEMSPHEVGAVGEQRRMEIALELTGGDRLHRFNRRISDIGDGDPDSYSDYSLPLTAANVLAVLAAGYCCGDSDSQDLANLMPSDDRIKTIREGTLARVSEERVAKMLQIDEWHKDLFRGYRRWWHVFGRAFETQFRNNDGIAGCLRRNVGPKKSGK